MSKAAAELKAGDRFTTHGTVVTVLTDAEQGTETIPPLTGQPCIRIRGRREDTGKEGTMTFGLSAGVFLEGDLQPETDPGICMIISKPEPTITVPSHDEVIDQLEAHVMDSQVSFETSDGCMTDPDGTCEHGHPTWLIRFGLI